MPTEHRGRAYRPVAATGEVLAKLSGADFDTDWVPASAPGVHASTHAAGSTDPVTVDQSQVTGLVAGLAAKQPLDSDLTAIAALSPGSDAVIQRKVGMWVASTPTEYKADLTLTKGDVGLGNVNNTSDAAKPVSTAQQTALDLKADKTTSPVAPTGQVLAKASAHRLRRRLGRPDRRWRHRVRQRPRRDRPGLRWRHRQLPARRRHLGAAARHRRGLQHVHVLLQRDDDGAADRQPAPVELDDVHGGDPTVGDADHRRRARRRRSVWPASSPATQIYFQDRDDASHWVKYNVTADGVDDGTYYDFAVAYHSGPGGIPAGQIEFQAIAPGTVGVPPSGTTGQVLAKESGADYDVTWIDAPSVTRSINAQTGTTYTLAPHRRRQTRHPVQRLGGHPDGPGELDGRRSPSARRSTSPSSAPARSPSPRAGGVTVNAASSTKAFRAQYSAATLIKLRHRHVAARRRLGDLMATRFVGVDDLDPRLPDVVIEATVGTTADDLAAGDTPAPTPTPTPTPPSPTPSRRQRRIVHRRLRHRRRPRRRRPSPPGFYYWDLTRAQPFWSDGAIWRDAGGIARARHRSRQSEVTFTLHEDAVMFSPWIKLIDGATGSVNWYDSDDALLAVGVNPEITAIPTDLEVTMRVESGAALVMSEVEIINLGFDHTEDPGPETPDAIYDYPPQPVVGISAMTGLTNLKYFMAADTPLTGTLNFTGIANLLAVECYSSDVEEVLFEGTAINRLCVENCRVTDLDFTPIAESIRDLRCAHGEGGPVTFHSDEVLTNLWHYCTRDQDVTTHLPMAQMPALIQWWTWNSDITTMDVPVSPVINSISSHHNAITSETLDAWLIQLAAGTAIDGGFNMLDAEPPTDASAAARATLVSRGWTLQLPDPIPGDAGWAYVAPTQVAWPATGIVTPSPPAGLSLTVSSGVLTWTSDGFTRAIMQPGARSAGDVYFEVVVDRSEVDGTAGTDRWMLVVNATAAGAGLKGMVRWPLVNGSDASGVIFGPSTGWSATSGTPVRINPNPAGWTNAGAHKVGLLHEGNVATIILDGVKVWQIASSAIGGFTAGGYVGVGGDPDGITRTYASWGLTEV